ncbi:MAG TPA: twin-arginine translocase subunit TatC [Thermoanaerobacterales bacterium]|nr:twin-arginine translocase subunit TatC [Thermoanaerobacterales bacterium]
MSERHEECLDRKLPIIEHLKELRSRLLVCVISIMLFSVASFILWPEIFPLLIPDDLSMVYISPQEALLVKIKISFLCGLLFSLPLVLFEAWKFIVPALTNRERKVFLFFGLLSSFLFLCGIYFGIFTITPTMVRFFLRFSHQSLIPLFSIASYSSFLISITLSFAIISQIPIIMVLVVKLGFVNRESIEKQRGLAVIFIFIIAAVITPPDAFSQMVLALPMWGLYELGLILTKFVKKSRQEL